MKWLAAAGILLAAAGGTSSCTSAAPAAEPPGCASGEGHWIEDDNNYWTAETHVTVRLCVSDTGKILDLEVE